MFEIFKTLPFSALLLFTEISLYQARVCFNCTHTYLPVQNKLVCTYVRMYNTYVYISVNWWCISWGCWPFYVG